LALSCEVVEKGGSWAAEFYGGSIPQILYIHFQIALTCEHVAGFGWVPVSELGGSWRKEEDRK